MKSLRIRSFGWCLFGLCGAATELGRAAVVEPNGQEVPILRPADPANYNETSIQNYFDGIGETAIDAVASARSEPGKFSPLCNFEATLVVSQSNAAAGISWYNVDESSPTRVPSAGELFELLKPTTTTQATFSAASIRADPNYAGGYIGFALTRYDNGTDKPQVPVYYSEYRRNTLCSGCTPPGQWIAALAFRSSLRSDTYYLAFEDWPTYGGSTPSDWHNDGDFNDKVFKIVGISCAGGGLECNTGKLGLCGKGVTECALDGEAQTCTPIYTARQEVCDAIDNDCNGTVDDGELCPKDQSCLHGSCVFPCGGMEFQCPDSLECGSNGFCIEAKCANVECEAGLACRNGICTSPCSDVVCPIGHTCVDGACKDLCTGKLCGPDSICQDGACVGTCGCVPCREGKLCDSKTGACVDPGCEQLTCPTGQACVSGACVDVCANAQCPGGAACTNGTCTAPPPAVGGSSSQAVKPNVSAPSSGTVSAGNSGPKGGSAPGNASATATGLTKGNGVAGSPAVRILSSADESSCGCRIPDASRPRVWSSALLVAMLGLAARRRSERRR